MSQSESANPGSNSSSSLSQNSSDFDWLSGGGEIGKLIRTIDWSQTPLGPVQTWPQSLRTTISICLSSNFPTSIVWGEEMVQIYNDSYRPICGDAHPGSLGAKFWDTWESARPAVGAIIANAQSGIGSYLENLRMFLERKGYIEEAFMTFSFSPISNEQGEIGGLFHPITETTDRMLHARRTGVLRDLGARLNEAKTMDDIYRAASQDIDSFQLDLPYLAFYEWEGEKAVLKISYGISPEQLHEFDSQAMINLGIGPHLSTALEISHSLVDPSASAVGPYLEIPQRVLVLPFSLPGHSESLGFALAAVSSRRALDEAYRSFYENLAQSYNAAISSVHALEQEQQRAEALAEIDRAKTNFFSNISHELRTPLTLMLGPIEDQLLRSEVGSAERERYDLIYRNGKRLRKLVNSLLDFSRIEAGRLHAKFALGDIVKSSADIASIFRSTLETAGLNLEVQNFEAKDHIYYDAEMWERIMLNLLSNAYKYTIEGSIQLSFEETDHSISVIVSDSGIGIPEQDLPKLFERFHRVEGARGRTYEGTGIGLSLVKQLMKIQGGDITVKSVEGKGTSFKATLRKGRDHFPSHQITDEKDRYDFSSDALLFLEEAAGWQRADDGPASAKTLNEAMVPNVSDNATADHSQTVLVVDDNADMRNYVAGFLSKYFNILVADNGDQALAVVKAGRVNLVLSDVMMPGLNGFELLQAIRSMSDTKDLPVILLSARAGEEAKLEGLREGANDYLVKPFSSRELIARVTSTLQISTMREETANLRANSNERLRSVFAQAAVGMLVLDLDTNILDTNATFASITGYNVEELKKMSVEKLNQPSDWAIAIEKVQDILAGRSSGVVLEKQLIRKDGTLCWVQVSLSAVRNSHNEIDSLIGVCEDIRARKESEIIAKDALNEAEKANRTKSMFLANMSHEIRTPLGIIQGYIDLLNSSNILPEEQQGWINIAKRNAQQLGIIIDDILDLSRVEADKIELYKTRFDLIDFLRDIQTTFAHKAEEKGLTLSIDYESAKDQQIATDRNRLRQILVNVVGNSIKFTSKGKVTLKYGFEKLGHDRERHSFRVLDTGIGMSREDQQKLFQPFSQADASINRSFGGTGLGLALSNNLAQLMGGQLRVLYSVPTEGSEFELELILDSLEAISDEVVKSMPLVKGDKPLSGLKILLVEDSPDNQLLISRILKREGVATIAMASDGLEGVEMAETGDFDLVLMDVQMPKMDGFEAVAFLRKKAFKTPVIALTAHAMKGYRDECIAAGFDDYLMKPIHREALVNVIGKQLGWGRES
jgi:PAS domain S-box-containing protein